MTIPITQAQLEQELLVSLLTDATNVLYREWLLDDPGIAWRRELVSSYLPVAAQALPLSALRFTAPTSDGASCRVELPRDLVKQLVVDYLEHLLHEAQRTFGTRLEGRRRGRAIHATANHVATSWTWIEF